MYSARVLGYARAMTPFLALATAASTVCGDMYQLPTTDVWPPNKFAVTAVDERSQAGALKRLNGGKFEKVSRRYVGSVVRDRVVPTSKHYYLAKLAWFSNAPKGAVPGEWVKIGVDVNPQHVAYVTTFLLTHAVKPTEFAAILAGPDRLREVVPICGAAE